MKHTLLLILALVATCQLRPQVKASAPPPKVSILVGDSAYAMQASATTTVLHKGWDIQGYHVGRKLHRCLPGHTARQQTDQRRPVFYIAPTTETLADYVLVPLRAKKDHRRFASTVWTECNYTRVTPTAFDIRPAEGERFRVQPLEPLSPGEYALVDLSQPQADEDSSLSAYDFCVK